MIANESAPDFTVSFLPNDEGTAYESLSQEVADERGSWRKSAIVSVLSVLGVLSLFICLGPGPSDLTAHVAPNLTTEDIKSMLMFHRLVAALVETDDFYEDLTSMEELDVIDVSFTSFISEYNRNYNDQTEHNMRKLIFAENIRFIDEHNANPLHSFKLGMNKFGDWTAEEFANFYLSQQIKKSQKFEKTHGLINVEGWSSRSTNWTLLERNQDELPLEVDWRTHGCVTEVKDQEQCGSCWAFSTTGAVEGAACAQTGVLPDLSEQQLVDCAYPEGNLGCNGGEADWGFQYIMDNGGLCAEKDYPYTSHELRFCADRECPPVVNVERFADVPAKSVTALMSAVALYGPVSVAIEADRKIFQFYKEGVLDGQCGVELDHAVLVVGYGTDVDTHEDFFIVKNSWGEQWGEDGYIRISRKAPPTPDDDGEDVSDEGVCGILMQASYAHI